MYYFVGTCIILASELKLFFSVALEAYVYLVAFFYCSNVCKINTKTIDVALFIGEDSGTKHFVLNKKCNKEGSTCFGLPSIKETKDLF